MHEDAVIDTLWLTADTDSQGIGLLVGSAGALVDAQGATAVAEGIALDAGAGIHRGIDPGTQALTDLGGRVGIVASGEGSGVGLLLHVTGRLVDREVALVLLTGIVDLGGIGHGGLG
ncbi:hypothetical protein D3C77_494830 [compost metagenome]